MGGDTLEITPLSHLFNGRDGGLFNGTVNHFIMTDFHIPHADDSEQAEEVYEGTAKFVEEQRGSVKREPRICRIVYYDGDKDETYDVSVGENVPRVGEPAIAIYESKAMDLHHICTPTRAVARGSPVMIGNHNVKRTEYFDEDSY